MNNLGLYLHVPFCKRKCEYCDFYSVTDLSLIPAYVNRLCEDLEIKSSECTGFCVDTVYLGGGTPSLLSGDEVERILDAVKNNYNLHDDAEITIEVNPSSITLEKAQKYVNIGITRASIGMQSACDRELALLGRLHNISEFDRAFDILRWAGFKNLSIDLMYGLPSQDTQTLKKSLEYIKSKNPEHISAYCLKVEQGTAFCEKCVAEADEDTAFEQYKLISDTLDEYGYHRYEVSNFAKDGYRSRHNCKYWTCDQYLGFGPGSYSYFGGIRYGYDRSISGYLQGSLVELDREEITAEEKEREKIIFGLRLSDGVDASLLDNDTVDRFVSLGLMNRNGSKVCLSTEGYFVSNSIISQTTFHRCHQMYRYSLILLMQHLIHHITSDLLGAFLQHILLPQSFLLVSYNSLLLFVSSYNELIHRQQRLHHFFQLLSP